MLKLKDFSTHHGKLFAAILLGLVLVGCGSGGGADNILCGGDPCPTGDTTDDTTEPTGTPAGIAAADKFSLSVSDFAPADAFDTDGIPVTLQVIVSDQFGNPVTDGTLVHFVSPESGQIDNNCTIAAGGCSVTWVSADPRPADGRVGILAYMLAGSEEFGDKNGNNIYDVADQNDFVDLGEACLDEDENGICEAGLNEFFVDSNNDGMINGGDSEWSGPCFSAIDNAAICTGSESVVISEAAVITLSTNTVQVISTGTFPAFNSVIDLALVDQSPVTAADCGFIARSFSGFIVSDSNGNALPTGTTITFTDPDGAFNFDGTSPTISVENQGPTGPFGISIVTNTIPTTGFGLLVLTVTLPDGTFTEFSWNTDDSQVDVVAADCLAKVP